MKIKLLLTCFLLILLTDVCFAITTVRVSDYGSDGFYYRYNEIAKALGENNLMMPDMPKKEMSNPNYDIYIIGVGASAHKTTMILFVNKEGYVSKIMIMGAFSDSITVDNIHAVAATILSALGVSSSERSDFINASNKNNINEVHWCNEAKRYIAVKSKTDYDRDIFSIVFTAGVD